MEITRVQLQTTETEICNKVNYNLFAGGGACLQFVKNVI